MFQSLLRFLCVFLVILVVSYIAHTYIISHFSIHSNSYILHLSYLFNGLYTLLLTSVIILLSKKLKDQLGFIFLVGSFMKIGVFLAILAINSLEIDKNVFKDFYIPYAISLIVEVYSISRILKTIK